ncbi:MAG: hypothetical protein EAZ68_07920, partial [Oscillatoriales cyanobacterium]
VVSSGDLTAKARSTRSKRRESLIQDSEERILYYELLVISYLKDRGSHATRYSRAESVLNWLVLNSQSNGKTKESAIVIPMGSWFEHKEVS